MFYTRLHLAPFRFFKDIFTKKTPIKGICERLVRTKSNLYFLLKTYDKESKSFIKLHVKVPSEIQKEQIFNGAWVSLEEYSLDQDKQKNPLYVVKSLKCLTRSQVFPKEFKKNQLRDLQTRYKNRLKDYYLNDKSLSNLVNRYNIIEFLRLFLEKEGYRNLDFAILEQTYGGAVAKPFTTYMNDTKKEFYLRISLEFPLFQHIAIGFPCVYSIGSVFRNECLDKTHTPEFTLLETMTTDEEKDLEYHIKLTENLYKEVYYLINKTYFKDEIDLRKPWKRYYKEDIDALCLKNNLTSLDDLQKLELLQPFHHIIGYPILLAKDENKRVESFVDHFVQLANYYDQETSWEVVQDKLKNLTEDEKDLISSDFKNALKVGVPPCWGWGLGVDRLILSVLNEKLIRDIHFAPLY